jgi:TraY domain-containing protein
MRMEKRRRGGWPARTPNPGERVPMSFRVTPEFKAKLDRAADTNGRSLAQEIEFRLERSLDEERHLADALELAFEHQVAGLMLAIGCVIKEQLTDNPDWLSDPAAFRKKAEAINLLLQAIDPTAQPRIWARIRTALDAADLESPEVSAGIVATGLANPERSNFDLGPWASLIRRWLGAAAISRLEERFASSPSSTRGNRK